MVTTPRSGNRIAGSATITVAADPDTPRYGALCVGGCGKQATSWTELGALPACSHYRQHAHCMGDPICQYRKDGTERGEGV